MRNWKRMLIYGAGAAGVGAALEPSFKHLVAVRCGSGWWTTYIPRRRHLTPQGKRALGTGEELAETGTQERGEERRSLRFPL